MKRQRRFPGKRDKLFKFLFIGMVLMLLGGSAFFIRAPSDVESPLRSRLFYVNRRAAADISMPLQAVAFEGTVPDSYPLRRFSVWMPQLPYHGHGGGKLSYLPLFLVPEHPADTIVYNESLTVFLSIQVAESGRVIEKEVTFDVDALRSSTPFTMVLDYVDVDFNAVPPSEKLLKPFLFIPKISSGL